MTRTPLHARVETRTPVLARRMVQAFVDELPVYATLPAEQLEGEVLAICEHNLRLFFRCLAEQRIPDRPELAELTASAARRAEERVPLEAVLSAYHLGGRIGWHALVEEAHASEHDELVAHNSWLLRYLAAVTGTVAAAYLEEQQLIYGEERDARRALADALLAPSDSQSAGHGHDRLRVLADRAGVELSDSYAALAVRLGPSGDERATGVSPAVAGRRKIRRLVDRLDQLAGGSVLSLLEPSGGLLLVPTDAIPAPVLLDGVVEQLSAAADAEVLLAHAWHRTLARVGEAAAEAREVLRIAMRLGATNGVYTTQDVLLEQALTTTSPWAERLAHTIDPLEAKPDLLATLEAWFASDFDRQATARALQVHPNTVDYRMQRVAEATGIDPGTARGLQQLGAALIARTVR